MTDCMFHSGDDCPAARELADLDRQIDLRMKAEAENKRLREALIFPKQKNNCGGWTIDFDFLSLFANAIHEKHDDFTASLEDIETILLAIEARAALGKE
jgi:hypothetical protein